MANYALEGLSTGAGLGSSFGLPGMAIGGGLGMLAGLFSKKRKVPMLKPLDLSAELAKLEALYGKQRESLTQDINKQTGALTSQAIQSMANRGIYSSPVSEKALIATRARGQDALGRGLADLYANEATAKTAAINNLLSYNQKVNEANQAINLKRYMDSAEVAKGLLGTGVSAVMANYKNPRVSTTMTPLNLGDNMLNEDLRRKVEQYR